MIYAFEEQIGDPSLFCGRKKQMELLINWANAIPRKIAKSRALLGRRKSGKSAIMQRLFNILWNQNGAVIPFYFEVQDYEQWLLEFSDAYYRTFVSQYLSFKTRTELAPNNRPWEFDKLISIAGDIDDKLTLEDIKSFQKCLAMEKVDQAMNWAFSSDADSCWALAFEVKNREEKNPPTLTEAQLFVTKIARVKQWLEPKNKIIKFVCPVYLSANGFDASVEAWLHEQGVLTADLESWERSTTIFC